MLLAGCASAVFLTGCGSEAKQVDGYIRISQEEAREMMARDDGHVIVDVRRQDEFDAGHIPGSILIPNEDIDKEPPEQLPDLDQIILIYCRSGNRSKQASKKLADMGYEEAELIDTGDGLFMTRGESAWMALTGSALLVGRK